MRRGTRALGWLICLQLTQLLCGCGSRHAAPELADLHPQPAAGEATGVSPLSAINQENPPTVEQLKALLMQEFARRGVDPDKVAAAVASGDRSAVFDLFAAKVDVDWDNPEPTERIILSWTEQAVGDYDMNGEVNIADLTPISALGWHRIVQYNNPKFSQSWAPLGSPLDVMRPPYIDTIPLGEKPLTGTGADNWRLARIDGDANGEINIADLVPISIHWHERLSGYRVYRRGPGEADFAVVADVGSPDSGYSVKRSTAFMTDRSQVNPYYAVRYIFNDKPAAAGTFAYYVAPYDEDSATEGPPSNTVYMNNQTAEDPGDPDDPVLPPPPDPEQNKPPTAAFSCLPDAGDAPLAVAFDASASSDPDGLALFYVWDFDGDGVDDTGYLRSAKAEHTYAAAGNFDVCLTVVDEGGLTASASQVVRVSEHGNFQPVAAFSVDPASGKAPLAVQFDASASTDAENAIVSYSWDWEGDGVEDFNSGEDPQTTHEYPAAGSYQPVLRVQDAGELTDAVQLAQPIEVAARLAPVAALTADPAQGYVELSVNFDASGSSDPEGSALSFVWDWEGDGSYDFDSADDPTASHAYTAAGVFNATVQVTSEFGLSATASVPITVNDVPNDAPEAMLKYEEVVGDHQAPQGIWFSPEGSADPDGTIMEYAYDWESDGEYDYTETQAYQVYHDFAAGTFTTTLRVTDNRGATDTASVQFTLTANEAPVAALTCDVDSGPAPLTINFDASGSFDPLGDALTYSWSWNETTDTPYVTHTFYGYGVQTISVQVSDSRGAYDTATVDIGLSSGWYLVKISDAGGGGFFPGIGMDIVNGNPAVTFSSNIWMYGTVYYSRAIDARGLSWSEPLDIMDASLTDEGLGTSSIAEVNGYPAAVALAYDGHVWFTMALDTQGSVWRDPVAVAYTAGGSGKSTSIADAGGRPALAWMDALGWLCYMRANDSDGTSWPEPVKLEKLGNMMWHGRVTLLINGTHPSIAYVRESDTTIRYLIGDDLDGASWQPPVIVYDVTSAPSCIGAALVSGNPCIAYSTDEGVCFQVAPDGLGATWYDPTIVTTMLPHLVNVLSANGLPAVVAEDVYFEAINPSGMEWKPPEIPGIGSGRAMAGTETAEGLPCIAVSDNSTWYAVRLPEESE